MGTGGKKVNRICAVIPAAGKGTRLHSDRPKIFTELLPGVMIYDIIMEKIREVADQISLVLSPEGLEYYRGLPACERDSHMVTTTLQHEPRGMGDAVFSAAETWEGCTDILVVWGDQVSISSDTLRRTREMHLSAPAEKHITLPTVSLSHPYIELELEGALLRRVREAREGDTCSPESRSDMGVFMLTLAALEDSWKNFVAEGVRGRITGEYNFLPFLAWLSSHKGWQVRTLPVDDVVQARGVNTPEDFQFFSSMLKGE